MSSCLYKKSLRAAAAFVSCFSMLFVFYKREVCAQPRSQPWTISSLLRCALKKQVHGIQLLSQLQTSRSLRLLQLVPSKANLANTPSPKMLENPNTRRTSRSTKSSKRKKKKSSHSSLQADPSPISSSELLEGSCTVSPNLGGPMQFHRPLPLGRACAEMLVRASYRCGCHFLLLSQCPSRR